MSLFWCYFSTWEKYVGQKYSPKNKYFFASFNNDRGLSLDDKTKDYVDKITSLSAVQIYDYHMFLTAVQIYDFHIFLTV